MRFLRYALLCLLVAFVAAGTAASVRAAERVALLIGNDEYRDENSRLLNAARDARDLGTTLERLGFKVILRQNANIEVMRSAVREFGAALDSATVALFFYAGHAIQVNGNNYLIPTNLAPRSEREVMFDGLELSPIIWMMGERTKKIVILDACRDNPFKEVRASAGLAQAVAPPDTLIAYATAPNAVAYDGAGSNGVFTRNLLRYISTPGDSIFKVFSKVSESVHRETKVHKVPQVPWILSSLRGDDFSFASRPSAPVSATPPATGSTQIASVERSTAPSSDVALNAERAFWESIDKTRRDELAEYLDRYPKGLFASIAQRRLTALDANPGVPSVSSASAGSSAAPGSPGTLVATGPAGPTTGIGSPDSGRPAADRPAAASPSTDPRIIVSPPSTAGRDAASATPASGSPSMSAVPSARVADRIAGRASAPSPTGVASTGPAASSPPLQVATAAPNSQSGSSSVAAVGATAGSGATTFRNNVRFPNGATYTGEMRDGMAHGSGEIQEADGYRYFGQFTEGRAHGKGVARWPDGRSFEGQFRGGLPNGAGVLRTKSGEVFEGIFRDGVIHGTGQMRFASGDSYEGEIVAGLPSGRGRLQFANGDAYEGDFLAGALTGKGTLRGRGGDVVTGDFRAGRANGIARLTMKSGDVYEGEFREHTFVGMGRYLFANGMRYEGEFANGEINGRGLLTYDDGRRFQGEFRRGLLDARGTLTERDGRSVRAEIVGGLIRPTN